MRVFLSAADASGDLHAADFVKSLRRRCDELELFGLGGAALTSAGLETMADQSELAIGGLVEVVSSVPRVLRIYTKLRNTLRTRAPDLVVLVDSPDLNLPLASVARRGGVPVLYYVAPQFWAWRRGRVRKIRRRVDHMAVIFPFEEALLRQANVPATFVGHPLVDRIEALRASVEPEAVARKLDVDLSRPILGLLPGSRHNEIVSNLPYMIETAELLRRQIAGLQCVLLVAPPLISRPIELPAWIRRAHGLTGEGMAISTCLLASPGTVTLEATLLRIPHIVTLRGNRFSFDLIRRITHVQSASMMNLVADAEIIPERVQGMVRPASLAALVAPLLCDPSARAARVDELGRIARFLGPSGASERVADLALRVAGRG